MDTNTLLVLFLDTHGFIFAGVKVPSQIRSISEASADQIE